MRIFPTTREREVMIGSSPDYSTSELLEMRARTRAALVGALDASLDSSHPAPLSSTQFDSDYGCGRRRNATSMRREDTKH
jgi:hypothetical protein